jgi:hypothetical protein
MSSCKSEEDASFPSRPYLHEKVSVSVQQKDAGVI